jgi:hypothetical protein
MVLQEVQTSAVLIVTVAMSPTSPCSLGPPQPAILPFAHIFLFSYLFCPHTAYHLGVLFLSFIKTGPVMVSRP